MFKTEELDLKKFNILTKYPSIYTRHKLDNRGNSTSEVEVNTEPDTDYYLTEKIDGTNSRIIILPDKRYLIGSREELLTADGDLIYNTNLGIVDTLRPYLAKIKNNLSHLEHPESDIAFVIYGETFGGNTHKNSVAYSTNQKTLGFRMFDAQRIKIDLLHELLKKDEPRIATWREHNNQDWLTVKELQTLGSLLDIPVVPYVGVVKGKDIPTDPYQIEAWLNDNLPETKVKLDDTGKGYIEGLIARTATRFSILKIRHDNYKRLVAPVVQTSPEM